jgi:hypothetical protein
MPDRPDPLDRLDAVHGVDVPDQWDDIVARTREPELSRLHAVVAPGGRPRRMLAAAAAAVLVIGAGAVIAVIVDNDEGGITTATNPSTAPVVTTSPVPATGDPGTADPGTIAPQPTVPATAPLTAPPTTVPIPELPLVPWCTETTGGPVTPPPAGEVSPFGRLDTEPVLTVTLPYGLGSSDDASTVRGVQPVDGGVVVLVQQTRVSARWQLVAINLDGSIRWRRCGSEQTSFGVQFDGDAVYVREQTADGAAWRGFDAVSGADAAPLPLDPALVPISTTDRYVLVVNDTDSGEFEDLQLADLATGAVTALPQPPFGLVTEVVHPPQVTERGDGSPIVTITAGNAVLAVFVDGEWRTDRDTLIREVPLRVTETFDGDLSGLGTGVLARDPLGATVWFHDTVNGIRAEGWATGVLGDVVLTNECRADDPTLPYGCAEQWRVALDLQTGDVLWEQPGFVGVGPSDRHIATIADDAGWSMVDVRTGEVLQADLPAFATACCGEDAFIWSDRDGGVVWSVDYQTMRVYYPVGIGPSPATVTLTD